MATDEFIGLDGSNTGSTELPKDNSPINGEEIDVISEQENRVPTPAHLITVNLIDKRAPIILLFGAPSCGKTMTLVRLAKYLRPKGYTFVVDANFCGNAWEYAKNMSNFNDMLDTNFALKGTGRNDFLLVKILDSKSNTVCQILEGAGEDYFPSNKVAGLPRSQVPFPAYMTTVFDSPNKKVWMFITEPYWPQDRDGYVDRIRFCKQQHFGRRDKCIIVYNKIERTPFANGETVNKSAAMEQCNNEYPGIFSIFRNNSPLPRFLTEPYDCKFVPFSTGTYTLPNPPEPAQYSPSKDIHPARLWEEIKNCIKG